MYLQANKGSHMDKERYDNLACEELKGGGYFILKHESLSEPIKSMDKCQILHFLACGASRKYIKMEANWG